MSIQEFEGTTLLRVVGPAGRLGGTFMEDDIVAAMANAVRHYAKIDVLQAAEGRFMAG